MCFEKSKLFCSKNTKEFIFKHTLVTFIILLMKGKDMKNEENKVPFEAHVERLQEIITLLEKGNTPLQESLSLYKEGVTSAKACQEMINSIKHEIQVLQGDELREFKPTDTQL